MTEAGSASSFKFVVVGDRSVGKTSLIRAYVHRGLKEFTEVHNDEPPTTYQKNAPVDGVKRRLLILDTDSTDADHKRLYEEADVVLICFSTVDPTTCENATSKWAPEVKNCMPRKPFLLVGTKTDLRDATGHTDDGHAWTFRQEDAKDAVRTIGAEGYVECSARRMDGLDEVFKVAARCAAVAQAGWLQTVEQTVVAYGPPVLNAATYPFQMARAAWPVLRQGAVNLKEAWANPYAFQNPKKKILEYAPFLSPLVPLEASVAARQKSNADGNPTEGGDDNESKDDPDAHPGQDPSG
ncbi:RhoA [Aphelenchoides avenae]|nr:RhoA [Aphelenchus avenae]